MLETYVQGRIKEIGNYVLEAVLGKGNFGTVIKARDKTTNMYYAIKKLSKKKINENNLLSGYLQNEIRVMQEIHHPNILHLFDYMESKDNYYLVVNYCNQGDMDDYMASKGLRFFEEEDAVIMLVQILNGFRELRKKQVLHRDFKTANILMSDDVLVIGDFGLAKIGSEMGSTIVGTPLTQAPELLIASYEDIKYSSKADIWSIGAVYYKLLFGEYPFSGLDRASLYQTIKQGCGDALKFPRAVSEESKDILRKMLTLEDTKRISWTELFEHRIFKTNIKVKGNISDGMEKMGKMVGPSSNQQIPTYKSPLEEFHNQKANVDVVDPNLYNVPAPTARQLEEKAVDPELERRVMQDMMMNEIKFRYVHEKNKILFLVYTVKQIQWALILPEFFEMAEILFHISMLITLKAKTLNDGLKYNLNNRNNIFKLNPIYWKKFLEGTYLYDTTMIFEAHSMHINDYYSIIKKRCEMNRINLREIEQYLKTPTVNLVDVDRSLMIAKQKIDVKLDMVSKQGSPFQMRIEALEKLIDICINCEQKLKYFTYTQEGAEKIKIDKVFFDLVKYLDTPFLYF